MSKIPQKCIQCDLSAIDLTTGEVEGDPPAPGLHLSANFGRMTRNKMKNIPIPLNSTEMILDTTLMAETSGAAAAMLNRGFISEAESEFEASHGALQGGDADSTLIGELADDRSVFFTEETKVDPKEMEALKEELAAARKRIEFLTKDKEELLTLLHQQKSMQEKLAGVNKKISKFLVPEMEEREEAPEARAANFRIPKPVIPPKAGHGNGYPDSWVKKLQRPK